MIYNIEDRVPGNAGRVIMTPVAGQANTYDMVRADDPSIPGTPLNRGTFMAMQGFTPCRTVFSADGKTITETGDTGVKVTAFNSDGSITETFTGNNGTVITKRTVFNADGSITETVE